jgi:hypothetical protein
LPSTHPCNPCCRARREAFDQGALYAAYERRVAGVKPDLDSYAAARDADPEAFYRTADSLRYGGPSSAPSEAAVDRMVNELTGRRLGGAFSRRRKTREDADVDSINDRNAHFNRKIERVFGKYTQASRCGGAGGWAVHAGEGFDCVWCVCLCMCVWGQKEQVPRPSRTWPVARAAGLLSLSSRAEGPAAVCGVVRLLCPVVPSRARPLGLLSCGLQEIKANLERGTALPDR